MLEAQGLSGAQTYAMNRSGFSTLSALAGAVVWGAFAVSILFGNVYLDRYRMLLLFMILVLVPIGFDLAATPDREGGNTRLYRLARFMLPFAAAAAAVSFLLPPGIVAAILAGVWLLFTVLAAAFGLWRLSGRSALGWSRFNIEELAITAALLYIPVGAAWLLVHRMPTAPLGFGGMIALLTAVHFHGAGFVALVIAGYSGRQLRKTRSPLWKFGRPAIAGIIMGPPLVAVGITYLPVMEVIAALVLAISLTLHGAILFSLARMLPESRARLLLRIAALASTAAMALAVVYAASNFAQVAIITIPQMAATHGVLNVIFGLAALAGWSIVRPGPVQR